MGAITNTVEGNLVSFSSPAKADISSLKCYFEPIQEGTGDPSPINMRTISGWNGIKCFYSHAGNNLISVDHDLDYTNAGITVKYVKENGHITVKGKSSANQTIAFFNKIQTNGTIHFKGFPNLSTLYNSNCYWKLLFSGQTSTSVNVEDLDAYTCNVTDDISVYVCIRLAKNVQCDIDFFPIIISDTIEITFPALGKNMLDISKADIVNSGITFGGLAGNTNADGTLSLAPGTYTFSANTQADVISITNGESKNITTKSHVSSVTFTLTEKEAIRIVFYRGGDSVETISSYQYQLESGSSVTTYEPFNNTLYGGYIDLISGQLIATHGYKLLNDPTKWNTSLSRSFIYDQNPFSIDYSKGTTHELKCTCCPPYDSNLNQDIYCRWYKDSNTYIYFAIRYSSTSENPPTIDDIKALSSQNKIGVSYELATPITYQLTSTQLQTFVGRNSIWSNANDKVSVTYDIHETSQIIEAKKKIIRNQPHIATASGTIVNFNTDMIAPLKSCKVYFNPFQVGLGDPSSTNIRSIYGLDELNYYTSTGLLNIITNNWSSQNLNNNACTIRYVEPNTFALDGILTSPVSLAIPIQTIRLNANHTYTMQVLIEPYGIIGSDSNYNYNIAVGLRSGSSTFYLIRYQQQTQVYTTTLGLQQNYDVDSIVLGFVKGFGNIKIHINILLNDYESNNTTWASTAGTLYGGYVDLITGKLIQTYEKVTASGINSENWSFLQTTVNHPNRVYTSLSNLNGNNPKFNNNNYAQNVYFNYLYTSSENQEWNGSIASYNNNILIGVPEDLITSTTAWNNYLSEHPLDIVYELETPIVYQLTPTQLNTLIGTNNIWSNANGNIEIKYWTH